MFVFNSRYGKHVATIATESAPIAIECIPEKDKEFLVTSGADMTLSTFSLDDPNPKRRFKVQSTWATPGVQMALAWAKDSRLLYSGATNGNIYSWNINKRSMVTQLQAHSDIVMNLIVLQKLNNIATASLDKTLGIFDSHTNEEILRLHGHKKGVFDLSYNPSYRLIFSCGFEHDACVWSPFVKSLVYRLKGHHASLVGVQTVPNTPEVISADTSGVFKLWDIRNFQCVQTFSANLSGNDTKDSSKLTCFFHTKLPSANSLQKEDDSRIYAASKLLFSFDQARVVHEATTDYTNVNWIAWNEDKSIIITASEQNVIVWDALIGSRLYSHPNICGEEISACCLDDRKRKVVIGDVKGNIGVYNCSNGALMKTVQNTNPHTVVSLEYYDEGKRFIAGYSNGLMCIYDENVLEDCHLIRSFEPFNMHPEMLCLKFCPDTRTVLTAGGSSNVARLWDYDSGKCEVELHLGANSSAFVVSIAILLPHPLVVVSDSNGNVIIWASKGTKWQGLRLSGFLNQTPYYAEYEVRTRRGDDEDDSPPKAIPPTESVEEPTGGAIETKTASSLGHLPSRQRGLRASIHPMSDIIRYDEIVKRTTQREAQEMFDKSEFKWGKVAPAQSLSWDLENRLLFTGDDMGTLRCFDLTDVLNDMNVETLLQPHTNHRIKGICRNKKRNTNSALPPLFEDDHADDFDAAASLYLLGQAGNAVAYLGVKFMWALPAHADRIVNCITIPKRGVMTSSADRLVKMWTFTGEPLGTLLQSVPVGTRSRSWELMLDIDGIIDRENEALDEIIEKAQEVVNDPNKPNIKTLDFTGMQLGAESADFSQSVLRQRIEKSAKLLGLDFANNHHSKPVKKIGHDKTYDDSTVSESTVSSSSKSLVDALKELKSTDAAIDYDLKTKQMSYIQQKRKANKLESISKSYEAKTGILIKTSQPTDLFQEEEDAKDEDLDKLLTSDEIHKTPARDEHSVNNDLYSVSTDAENSPKRGNKHASVKSKLSLSIKEAQDRGPRTISMIKSCRKYTAYDALDSAMKNKTPKMTGISPEDIAEIRAQREKKHKDLMQAISLARNEKLPAIAPTSKTQEPLLKPPAAKDTTESPQVVTARTEPATNAEEESTTTNSFLGELEDHSHRKPALTREALSSHSLESAHSAENADS